MHKISIAFVVTIIAGCFAASGAAMLNVNDLPMHRWEARRAEIKFILEHYFIDTIHIWRRVALISGFPLPAPVFDSPRQFLEVC